MALLASSIFDSCQYELNDPGYVRWPVVELCAYLTEAVAALAVARPTLFYSFVPVGLAPGAVQSVPAQYAELVDIIYNLSPDGTPGGRIVKGSFSAARALGRFSCASSSSYVVNSFTMHPENDTLFFVDPPVPAHPAGYSVQAVVQLAPSVITAATDAVVMANTTPELYVNALKDWTLYRAFAKDLESQSSFERSQAHFKAFTTFAGSPPRTKTAVPLASIREKTSGAGTSQ